jgi:hypothetical protein
MRTRCSNPRHRLVSGGDTEDFIGISDKVFYLLRTTRYMIAESSWCKRYFNRHQLRIIRSVWLFGWCRRSLTTSVLALRGKCFERESGGWIAIRRWRKATIFSLIQGHTFPSTLNKGTTCHITQTISCSPYGRIFHFYVHSFVLLTDDYILIGAVLSPMGMRTQTYTQKYLLI